MTPCVPAMHPQVSQCEDAEEDADNGWYEFMLDSCPAACLLCDEIHISERCPVKDMYAGAWEEAGDLDRFFECVVSDEYYQEEYGPDTTLWKSEGRLCYAMPCHGLSHLTTSRQMKNANVSSNSVHMKDTSAPPKLVTKTRSQMVQKKNRPDGSIRKLHSSTVRNMLQWGHFKFRQLLQEKAKLYPWVTVVIVTEAYTSKTCGGCGKINRGLRGAKEFKCPDCRLYADRDIHAAKNILLKRLTDEDIVP